MFEKVDLVRLARYFMHLSKIDMYREKPENHFVFEINPTEEADNAKLSEAIRQALRGQLNERMLTHITSWVQERGEEVVARFLCRFDLSKQGDSYDDLWLWIDRAIGEQYQAHPSRSNRPFTSRPSEVLRE